MVIGSVWGRSPTGPPLSLFSLEVIGFKFNVALMTPHWELRTWLKQGVLRWGLGHFNTSASRTRPHWRSALKTTRERVWWHFDGADSILQIDNMTRYWQFLEVPSVRFQCVSERVTMYSPTQAETVLDEAQNCVCVVAVSAPCIVGTSRTAFFTFLISHSIAGHFSAWCYLHFCWVAGMTPGSSQSQ